MIKVSLLPSESYVLRVCVLLQSCKQESFHLISYMTEDKSHTSGLRESVHTSVLYICSNFKTDCLVFTSDYHFHFNTPFLKWTVRALKMAVNGEKCHPHHSSLTP